MKTCLLALALSAILSGGCTLPGPARRVQVEAFADRQVVAVGRYVLVPRGGQVDTTGLRYREYAGWVERALAAEGLRRVERTEDAELIVSVDWGVADLHPDRVIVREPAYARIQGGSPRFNERDFSDYDWVTAFGSSTSVPTSHVVGTRTRHGTEPRFSRWVRLQADRAGPDERRPAWDVTALSVGPDGDLRRELPLLLAALSDRIGSNPERLVVVDMTEDDARVRVVRGED